MNTKPTHDIRNAVRNKYGAIATASLPSCGCGESAACCGGAGAGPKEIALALGYTPADVDHVPEGANMGLGCGNPQAIAALKPGETVLDLGSGGGFDCFLAARQVGEQGKVIGVDMTPEMVAKARANAQNAGAPNVEFRLGEIEHLPVADGSIDLILSNCVINLSPDKQQVYREAFRVLKPGGRIAVSDVVATAAMPASLRNDLALVAACVGGAETIENLERILREAGFESIAVKPQENSRTFIRNWVPGKKIEAYVVSAAIEAVKPLQKEARAKPIVPKKAIQKAVYGHYESGYHCAEVISQTVLAHFSDLSRRTAIRISSAFGGGIAGTTEELCGAFTGGVIAISSLLGRETPSEDLKAAAALTKAFKKGFLDAFGTLNCHAIMERHKTEKRQFGCVQVTADAAVLLADLLAGYAIAHDLDLKDAACRPKEKVGPGQCPFGGQQF